MDTIVAISTAIGNSGINIIRMSGKESFNILGKIFVAKKDNGEINGYSMKYGNIIDEKKQIVDEVLVSYFVTPKSYTTENMCEINSHGGNIIVRKILEICLRNGARLAEPGEFTKRAFLNGRIDLSQAEAVIDIINGRTEKEVMASEKQLEGVLSKEIKKIRKNILDIMTDIEASIDYPEYDIEEVTNERTLEILNKSKQDLIKLYNSYDAGKIIKEGINIAIIGRPNAGKSSLLNAILREERAIVTEIEGTTRDAIEEFITIEGIPLKIIDTAGIRETSDIVEKIGIERAKKIADKSDVVIAIIDASKELQKEDKEILEIIKDKKAIIVLNKEDLNLKVTEKSDEIVNAKKDVVRISAINNDGIERIYEKIIEMFNLKQIDVDNEITITSTRHRELIRKAIESNEKSIDTIRNNIPIDVSAIYLKEILDNLGEIIGENTTDELIKDIFSKFCLGK